MSNSSDSAEEPQLPVYGKLDASYQAAGEEPGLRKLCTDFYRLMETLPEAEKIFKMHRENSATRIDKLTLFLCGWLGGPKKFQEKYGSIHIPMAHRHLVIGETERDAWLLCMDKAIELQPYSPDFKQYLSAQLRIPAERIRQTALK